MVDVERADGPREQSAGGLDVSVVLPTYNESASLPVLIPKIVEALARAQLRGEVIVVDDASPDHTADVAREIARTYPVRVLERKHERGLATAVIAGFQMSRAEVCVVMDADGSHPIDALPQMVRMILADQAEIVVGSRHVPGGGSTDWPLFSQLKSRFAASLAVGLSGMTDPTTGYMALRRSVFERVKLDPVGWKIVLEMVVKAHPARLAEVPIVFADRELGESKQSLRVLSQYLEHLYKLYKFRFPTFVELLKFCFVGFFGLVVDLSIVFGLKSAFALDTRLCQVFGFAVAVTFNWAINRRFSFERAREAPLFRSYVAYVGTNLVGLTVRMLAIDALMRVSQLDQGSGFLLLSVIGIVLATLVNFVGVKYFAFAPEQPAAVADRVSLAPPAEGPRRGPTLAVLAMAGALFALLSFRMQGERSHDERVNMVMAENIARGWDGFVHPSVTPGPVAHWQQDALPALGNTPLYPALLALALPLGEHGPDLVSLGVLALLWAGTFFALAPIDRSAAHTAALLLATSPAIVSAFSRREFEPLVAALCLLGFAFAVRALALLQPSLGLAGGAGVGLAFATKMWLFLPGLLACVGLFVASAHDAEPVTRRRVHQTALWFALGCAALALSHLLFVAIVSPHDLGAWLEWVYLGLFSGRGITAPKLSSVHASAWAYVGWLLRDHGALLAPLVLGLPAATRRMGRFRAAMFAAIVGALLALVPLSVPAAKEPLYMAPVLPFLYALVALSLVAPDRVPERFRRVNRGAAQLSLFVVLLLAMGWLGSALFQASAAIRVALPLAQIALWSVPSWRTLAGRSVAPTILPCAVGSLLLTACAVWVGPLSAT
ncbi:MAG TPA: glycosyltransferase family 2 protein [Polyangiales bacterium]|nr:glycosyltransferase family 2 protein [Polyangiales bacterium]